jgi:hypothetical protein
MVIAPGGVGLPDFQQHIAHRRSGAVDNPAFDSNAFALGGGGERRAKIFLKNMKPAASGARPICT